MRPVECRHFHGRSQRRLGIGDRQAADEMTSFTAEERMFFHPNKTVTIAWGSTVTAWLAFARDANAHLIVDASGDYHTLLNRFFNVAVSVTATAWDL